MNGICMLCFGPWLKRCIIFWHARCPCSRGKRPVTYLDMDTVGANANDTDRDISLFWIKHIPYFWYWLQAVYFCCTIWSTVGIHWHSLICFFCDFSCFHQWMPYCSMTFVDFVWCVRLEYLQFSMIWLNYFSTKLDHTVILAKSAAAP